MPAGSTYVVGNGRISSFLWLNNISMFVCVCVCVKYITTFCPFICPCILRLFPFLGCCKKNAALNMRVQVSLLCSVSYAVFCFSFINTQMCNWLDHMVAVFLIFFAEPPYCFPKWLYQFTVLPAVCKSLFSMLSPAFIFCLFDSSHSNRHEVIHS